MAKGVKGSSPTDDVPVRTSYNIKPSITQKLRYIALKDNTNATALTEKGQLLVIKEWERKNGEIKL